MALSNTPDFIDQTVRVTKANPAPGAYNASTLPSGDKISQSAPDGMGKFGKNEKSSFLDEAVRAKEAIPAPGTYKSGSSLDKRTTSSGVSQSRTKGLTSSTR